MLADLNGCAGSLEMYLGRGLLTVDGELTPVQWTGYVKKLNRYQASLPDHEKRRVQKAFLDVAKKALHDPAVRAAHDWSGVHAIIETVVEAFA